MNSTWDRIKRKIKTLNTKNILYCFAKWILVLVFLFVLVTTIIQTEWIQFKGTNVPLLIWMVGQPYVGVFFLPFLILVIYICYFIVSVAKPITIKNVKSDVRTLFENDDIEKIDYEKLFENLNEAEKKQIARQIAKKEELKKLVQEEIKEIEKGEKDVQKDN